MKHSIAIASLFRHHKILGRQIPASVTCTAMRAIGWCLSAGVMIEDVFVLNDSVLLETWFINGEGANFEPLSIYDGAAWTSSGTEINSARSLARALGL